MHALKSCRTHVLPCGPCMQGIGQFYFTTDSSNISAEATVGSTAANSPGTTSSPISSAGKASTGYCPAGDRRADGCFSAWHGYQVKQGQVSAQLQEQDPLVRRFVGFGTNEVVGGLLLHQVGCLCLLSLRPCMTCSVWPGGLPCQQSRWPPHSRVSLVVSRPLMDQVGCKAEVHASRHDSQCLVKEHGEWWSAATWQVVECSNMASTTKWWVMDCSPGVHTQKGGAHINMHVCMCRTVNAAVA